MPMPAALTRTLKILSYGIGTIALLGVLWFAINLFDEKLTPAAQAYLMPPADTVPAEANGYYALIGLSAPAGESPQAVGRQLIADYNRKADAINAHPGDESLGSVPKIEHPLQFIGETKDWTPSGPSLWAEVKAHRDQVEVWRKDNAELLARYRALWHYPSYVETAKPGYAQPFPMTVRKPRVLFLADLADRMQRGTVKEQRAALGDLSADLAFWMRVLHGQGTLLSTMLAVAFVHGDELLLVDAIQDPMVPITAFDSQYPWLTPMPNTAWQIGDAFAAEMRFMYEVLRPVQFSPRVRSRESPDSLGNRIAPTFFKLNATMNLQAERVSQLQALAVGDPDTFSARQREFEEWNLKALSSISLASVYNPMGRMMLATEGSAFVRYIGRSYDVAAVQRLGCLVYQLRKQNIATKDVAAFMATHPEISTHPVDRTPFLWNAKTRELTVPRKAEWPVGRRFSVTLAPEPQ